MAVPRNMRRGRIKKTLVSKRRRPPNQHKVEATMSDIGRVGETNGFNNGGAPCGLVGA
jgi:hypothetical protein